MNTRINLLTIIITLLAAISVSAQSTMTYQGTLDNGGSPANGKYDFEYAFYNDLNGGTALNTLSAFNVPVTNGSFRFDLNFAGVFDDGGYKYLEIRVREAGGSTYTTLTPRQKVNYVPTARYSLISLNALQAGAADNAYNLDGVPASQYVLTSDDRLTDARNPLPGSGNYIQNRTTVQGSSNFNVSGIGKGGILDATTEFRLNGSRILGTPAGASNLAVGLGSGNSISGGTGNTLLGTQSGQNLSSGNLNTFLGVDSGRNNTTGSNNTYVGNGAGFTNSTGTNNTFVGLAAGQDNTARDNVFIGSFSGSNNTTGIMNTFVGRSSGLANNSGNDNVFVGASTGDANQAGDFNTFVGQGSGGQNTGGNENSFFGRLSGFSNTTGNGNTFIGRSAGSNNSTGNNNTTIGDDADTVGGNLSYATAIGSDSRVGTNNTIVLGRPGGEDKVYAPGKLSIGSGVAEYSYININRASGNANVFLSGDNATKGINIAVDSTTTGDASMFIAQYDGTTFKDRFVIQPDGAISIPVLGSAGSTPVCRNSNSEISFCSSSKRYKSNIESYFSGSEILNRLRPVTFNWKDSGALDVGLVAEEVADIEPLLVTFNENGVVEGVKYDRIGVVLVNVVKEQKSLLQIQNEKLKMQNERIESQSIQITNQAAKTRALEQTIEAQKAEIKTVRSELEDLKTMLCSEDPGRAICKPQDLQD